MLKRYILPLIALFLSSQLMAEVVVLHSGQRIKGEIILQNEEVVIIRSNNGMRYQYPRNEVVSIHTEDTTERKSKNSSSNHSNPKSAALRVQAIGGALYVPYLGWGGSVGADLLVGAGVMNGRVFIGGGIGYRAKIISELAYSFIPLQVYSSIVLSETRHAPLLGINLGYGFSTNRNTQGGICVGIDLGWHYTINAETGLTLGLNAEWQQTQTDVYQSICHPITHHEQFYINHMGLNFMTLGTKIAIHF